MAKLVRHQTANLESVGSIPTVVSWSGAHKEGKMEFVRDSLNGVHRWVLKGDRALIRRRISGVYVAHCGTVSHHRTLYGARMAVLARLQARG